MENNLIRSLLPGHGVMVDVGACHGKSHAPFIGWEIYAFEPDPDNRRRIPRHDGVTIDERAISDCVKSGVPFYRTPDSYGMSSMLSFSMNHKYAFDVDVTTLTIALADYGIGHVDYLKVDAEGYDLMVLKGFPFEQIRPQVVMCEFGNSKTELLGYTHDDMAGFMIDLGYRVVVSEWVHAQKVAGRYQHKWLGYFHYPPPPERVMWWGNMIAFRDDYLYRRFCDKAGIGAKA
jgi:FkbM family methyltransferase